MNVIFLFLLLVVLWLSQKFIRQWFFERRGFVPQYGNPMIISSPVDGVVCYVKKHSDFVSKKRWDSISLSKYDGAFMQIGIYMSGYDRHIVHCPVLGTYEGQYVVGEMKKNVSMIDLKNFLMYYYLGRTPKLVETPDNFTRVYEFYVGNFGKLAMAVIADKFVGRVDDTIDPDADGWVGQYDQAAVIKRGSQVDLFIHEEFYKNLIVEEGDQVRIGEVLVHV